MCGITGILSFNRQSIPEQTIQAMNNALSHRGPDDEGYYTDAEIALGHKRLSIIDLSSAGHQPMTSADGRYVIVFNGEIYNYLEIRAKIPEYPFSSNTDTEVALAAYRKWGAGCLEHFNGMFAIAIWDTQSKELFIARDRLGKKPLYYHHQAGFFLFSSEIRSLLASRMVKRKINREGLIDFLRYQTVHAPFTILQDIFMLLPGHYLRAGKGKVKITGYWKPEEKISTGSLGKSYASICSDIRSCLLRSVERRLVSDVPLAAFLSGGIDSSGIVGLMSQVSSNKAKTFTVVFDEAAYSEAKYARMVADKFHTDHHEIKLTPGNFLEQLPAALKALDHPSGDGPNTYVLSKKIKEAGITVALSGLGGDELFAGYAIFRRSLALRQYQWLWALPEFIRHAPGTLLKMLKPGVSSEKIARLLSLPQATFQHTYPLARQVWADEQIKKMVADPFSPVNAVAEIIKATSQKLNTPTQKLTEVSIAEIHTYMQNVLLRDTDQMSMASALEVRNPFLDFELAEYVLGVEDRWKYPHFPKKLLVDALGGLLPEEIVHRPKMGFTFPWEMWMKNELKVFCEKNIRSLAQRNFMNEKELKNTWVNFLHGDKRVPWARVWILVVLENWLKENQIDE